MEWSALRIATVVGFVVAAAGYSLSLGKTTTLVADEGRGPCRAGFVPVRGTQVAEVCVTGYAP